MNNIGNNRTKLDDAREDTESSLLCRTWVRACFKIRIVVWLSAFLFRWLFGGFQKFIIEGYRCFGEFLRLGQIEWHCSFPSITVDNRPSGLQRGPCVVGEQVRVVK